jgi:hypothetical protein
VATLELFRTLRRLVVDGGRLSVADNVALTQARRERERGWLVVDGGRLSVADNVALTQAPATHMVACLHRTACRHRQRPVFDQSLIT